MAARIPVLLKPPYEVIVGHDSLPRAGEFIAQILPAGKCGLVTDENVAPLYAGTVRDSLTDAGFSVTTVTIPAGENSKSLHQPGEICDRLIAGGVDRGGFLVALGGGVVGDLAGFAASVYSRGIPHIQIPTTVVAQVDSSIGGKTGVNSRAGKNLIGSFHQPALVITDPDTLATLPKREFNEGMAEVIKHAVIRDAALLDDLEDIARIDLPSLIARNVKIKAAIIAADEFETEGLRAQLNFGHTIGHAIENAAGYGRYLHGEAISLGLAAALYLSVKKAGFPPADAERTLGILRSLHLPVRLPADLTTDALMAALSHDKKFQAGAIRYILSEKPGSAFVSKDITADDLREAIEHIRE